MDAAIATTAPTNLAQSKPRRLEIGRKLKAVIDHMVFDGDEMAAAAQKSKITTRAVRKAFEKPHVLAHIRRRKDVLRASISAKNIQRLGEIRDAANNMPAIHAIRELENTSDDNTMQRAAARVPGLVIQVFNGPAVIGHDRSIEHKPLKTLTDVRVMSPEDDGNAVSEAGGKNER